ncbi:MAG TPA: RHS repeat-associated core domain-containing protein, partial [Methylomirabilota bacterium]|nr:RHS repeat-associated core domain-containing protein [Methylomirabilota bacterium]
DGSYSVTTNQYGRALSITQRDSGGTQIGQTLFGYDEHGRQKFMTDARNGTTTNFFDVLDRIVATASPAPATGSPSPRTGYRFDTKGQVTIVTNTDNTLVYTDFTSHGSRSKMYGSHTYPVEYTYDYAGRMKTMKTWQDYAGNSGTVITTWNYDGYRGFMTNKVYADGKGPGYIYTPAGRLYQRIWARGTVTTYTTNAAGDVSNIAYSDGTSSAAYFYDRLGRKSTIFDGAGIHSLRYDVFGNLTSETNSSGILAGMAVINSYDNLNRRVATRLNTDTGTIVNYGYDGASRLLSVTNGVNTASYSYVANSPLVSQIEFKQSGNARMTTIKSFDYLNRLTLITNAASGSGSENAAFAYANNSANQRTSITNADGSRWAYSYDALGQVRSGRKYWSDGTPVAGQQFDYTFDDIGNRKTAAGGGDEAGTHQRLQNYTVNNLNQYTQRTVPGYLDILGTATNTSTITVNHASTSRKGNYYRGEVPLANSASALWFSITNVAVLASGTNDYVTNCVDKVFVPGTPEIFRYDADGNMTNDGRWELTWDGENRLTGLRSMTGAPVASSNRLTFAYDAKGRRISKVTETFVSGAWSITLSNRFVYDDWNLLAELNATNNAVINSFMWGLDLSGTMQGAGGVGGPLGITTTNAGTHFVGYDGNGNVAVLVSANSGTATANYEYDPFGNVLRATGPMALLNPFRFSTKYVDDESGFNYYGYRFYNALVGRWLNRDPIGEAGGVNLYCQIVNNPVTRFDPYGLTDWGDVIEGWWDAAWNTFDWATGHSGSTDYGPDSVQSRQMSQSAIAGQLRAAFLKKNKDKLCNDWKGISNVRTRFRVSHEVIVDGFNGTAEFVGRASGDVIAKKDLVNCKINAEFHFMNTTSLKSLLYGKWPESWNVTLPGFPFANWTQFYTWNETFDCNCCHSTGVSGSW